MCWKLVIFGQSTAEHNLTMSADLFVYLPPYLQARCTGHCVGYMNA
jgi:hypothetical protein